MKTKNRDYRAEVQSFIDEHNLTQSAFCRLSGISTMTLRNLLLRKGGAAKNKKTCLKLTNALAIPEDEVRAFRLDDHFKGMGIRTVPTDNLSVPELTLVTKIAEMVGGPISSEVMMSLIRTYRQSQETKTKPP